MAKIVNLLDKVVKETANVRKPKTQSNEGGKNGQNNPDHKTA